MNCPNCSDPLSERGCFCKSCGAQARCLHCRELLEPAAMACVECGTCIGNGRDGSPQPVLTQSPEPTPLPADRNTISFQEDRNNRTFSASLTDNAIQGLGDTLAEFFAQRGATRTPSTHRASFQRDSLDGPQGLPAPADNASEQPLAPVQEVPAATGAATQMATFFKVNGESLELIDNRLKGTNGTDYLRRLFYLFLYAHELYGHASTPKTDVITVLKEGKIWDANASHWLKKKHGFKVDADDRLQLIGSGRDDAKKFLTEALDGNIADEWNPDKKVVKPRAPRKKKA